MNRRNLLIGILGACVAPATPAVVTYTYGVPRIYGRIVWQYDLERRISIDSGPGGRWIRRIWHEGKLVYDTERGVA